MFGLLMAIVWITVACAARTRDTFKNSKARKKAIKNGRDTYLDADLRCRDVDTNAVSYMLTDMNGDTWKIYQNRTKSNVNLTQQYRMNEEIRLKRECEDYERTNRLRAEKEGWRFYKVKNHNDLLKYKANQSSKLRKGYDVSGPDVFIDRENGHECYILDSKSATGACYVYDITDGRPYNWFIRTMPEKNTDGEYVFAKHFGEYAKLSDYDANRINGLRIKSCELDFKHGKISEEEYLREMAEAHVSIEERSDKRFLQDLINEKVCIKTYARQVIPNFFYKYGEETEHRIANGGI